MLYSKQLPENAGEDSFFFFLLSFLSFSFGFWYLFRPSIKKRIRWSSDWRQKKKHRGLVAAGGLLVVSSVKVGTEALPCLCVCIFISVLYYWQGDLYIYILSTTSTVKQKKRPPTVYSRTLGSRPFPSLDTRTQTGTARIHYDDFQQLSTATLLFYSSFCFAQCDAKEEENRPADQIWESTSEKCIVERRDLNTEYV